MRASSKVADSEGGRRARDGCRCNLRLCGSAVACGIDFRRTGVCFVELQGGDVGLRAILEVNGKRNVGSILEGSGCYTKQHYFTVATNCLPALLNDDSTLNNGKIWVVSECDGVIRSINNDISSSIKIKFRSRRRYTVR